MAACLASAAALAAENERSKPGRYDWLTAESLAPPEEVVQAAIDALPTSLSEKQDWLKRMRRAAWIPQLELRYTVWEDAYRKYNVIDRQEVTSGSETRRESFDEDGSASFSSSRTSTENVFGGNGAPLNVQTEQRLTSESESGSESSSSDGSSTQRRSFKSTTSLGPDSYVTDEDLRWAEEYGIFLTWDLSRVLFRAEEIDAVAAEIDIEAFKNTIKTQVIQTYYDLLTALEMLGAAEDRGSIPTRVRRDHFAFLLDTLTDGYITKHHESSAGAGEKAQTP
jgi:hypothetical protein